MTHDAQAMKADIRWALDAMRRNPDLTIDVLTIGGGRSRCSWIDITDAADGSAGVTLHVDDEVATVIRMPLSHVVGVGVGTAGTDQADADGTRVPPSKRAMTLRAIAIGEWGGRGDEPTYSDLSELLDEVDGSGQALIRSDRPLASVSEANVGLADKVLLHLARRNGPLALEFLSPRLLAEMLASMGGGWPDTPVAQRVSDLIAVDPESWIDPWDQENQDLVALWRIGRLFATASETYHPFIGRGEWADAIRENAL